MNERAVQFAPFASLRGYSDITDERSRLTEPRRELSEDEEALLSEKLGKLRRRMTVTVTYYKNGQYVTVTGKVTEWEPVFRRLSVNGVFIPMEDIFEILLV